MCIYILILRHAWLNLWDKHMTTGRINQVFHMSSMCITAAHVNIKVAKNMSTLRLQRFKYIRYTGDTAPICMQSACIFHWDTCCHNSMSPHCTNAQHSFSTHCNYINVYNCNICCNCIFKFLHPGAQNCYKELDNCFDFVANSFGGRICRMKYSSKMCLTVFLVLYVVFFDI